ncbi:MAG: septal ring lytic transglycosylase RlpA family protein [Rhizobium sp.]|nr:septal ring lytic transglycosylase RlpA family protein [Rhizobium sp.]
MSRAFALLALALLAGCAGKPVKPSAPEARGDGVSHRAMAKPRAEGEPAATVAASQAACLQVREHRDEDYTPGGLYAPGVSDSAPEHALDLSGLVEPTPRREPPAAYGNRSPYTVLGKSYRVMPSADGYVERGVASWYGQKFHGRQTSSREVYDMCSFSAAHKTLPLPSYVRVTHLDTGESVVVRVNDRGPFHSGRIIDLSYAAAVKLGLDRTGTARVEVRALTPEGDDAGPVLGAGSTPSPPTRAPAPVATGDGRHVVQVGAYRERDNARRIARQLEDAGIDGVEVEDARVNGGKVWRVRVGPLAAEAAAAVIDRIRGLGLPSPRVFSE